MVDKSFSRLLTLVVVLAAVGQITNTIYVPAMTEMAYRFTVIPSHIQAVMAAYLVMYGLSQLVYGPISDRIGRRPTILIGLGFYILGSLLASFAANFLTLIVGSLIQGAGIGVGGVMARTVMRDRYSGRDLYMASSYVSVALIFAPLVAPILGGVLTRYFGWRSNFIFLLLFGIAVLYTQWRFFTETNLHIGEKTHHWIKQFSSYIEIVLNKNFVGSTICLLTAFSGISVFEATAGILLGHNLHYSPTTLSWLFISVLPSYLLGAFLAGKLNSFFSSQNMLIFGIVILLLATIPMFLLSLIYSMNVYLILVPVGFYLLGAGILFPTATAFALESFPTKAGAAGALLGGVQNLGAGVFTTLSASIPQTSLVPLASILLLLALITLGAYWFLLRQPNSPINFPRAKM